MTRSSVICYPFQPHHVLSTPGPRWSTPITTAVPLVPSSATLRDEGLSSSSVCTATIEIITEEEPVIVIRYVTFSVTTQYFVLYISPILVFGYLLYTRRRYRRRPPRRPR
mmetsp:Transcript_44815/g.51700  ORF Transcript_44815/g.51700 Transcript_44815/m.51700 type:complete len:110 (+) Transcript_44815:40-369(+)